jgi:NDP-sugar pyrophosphorylase family protein
MDNVLIISPDNIGRNFIPDEYLPKGKDEYYQRNKQIIPPKTGWRHLRSDEVERLVKNDNTADNWDEILVTDHFDTNQVKNSRFYGLVRIGCIRNIILQHHDLSVPSGITNSLIVSCDIGDDVAIHNVHYLAHYIIGDRCILFNIQEMNTTDHAKFGNGVIKDGEPENVRTWLDLMNETGCRRVLPFDGMITADAYLWAKFIDDSDLQGNLKKITQKSIDNRRGYYGTTGDHCVIKNSNILKDVKISSHCYIKGANKLKNLTINSSREEPTQIGEGVELVNGIIGYGCHIFYGCKAVKFILGNNSNLKYGARLINSFLGDNSTISCCEVLNNLIFPAHEQHHNNSFLIASVVMGQSNMAAGATIGSNHNSRANDNEIQAGRGFWPGLCTSVKHSCRFASFVLLSKADYPAELDIPLPFSLLNNNVSKDQLEVMPAYWWLYNMYALARNSWKFQNRDKRVHKDQNIEFDPFAPDTAEEIFNSINLLEIWTAKASLRAKSMSFKDKDDDYLASLGRDLLSGKEELISNLEVLGEKMENTKRKVVILKTYKAYHAYRDILHYYATKNLMAYMSSNPKATFSSMCKDLKDGREKEWVNLGGQMMLKHDVDKLRSDIGSGKLKNWKEIHERYDELWIKYKTDKQKHAFATLCELYGIDKLSKNDWKSALEKTVKIQKFVSDQVYISRKKDFDNPFRMTTFRNMAEMKAAFGNVEENSFIVQVKRETEDFEVQAEQIKKRSGF